MTEIQQQVDDLRKQLITLSQGVEKLKSSGMKEKTVLVLLKHHTGLPQHTLKKVMNAIEDLEEEYFGE